MFKIRSYVWSICLGSKWQSPAELEQQFVALKFNCAIQLSLSNGRLLKSPAL